MDVITEHTDRDLIGAKQTVYGQSDFRVSMYKGDKLQSWGYWVTQSKDEDCFYAKFQSTMTVMELKGLHWDDETETESKIEIFGGTGKYLGVKGSGICKAMASGQITKCEGEWEY